MTGDGWQTADPASVGFDPWKLDRAAARIRDGTYQNVHSLLVVKDGKLVFEEYFRGAATGQRMDAFAEQHLFAPLGTTNYRWDRLNADTIHASGNLELRPRDMAKFGLLHLNGGMWGGQRIVSQEWVDASTQIHAALTGGGYGYQWWLRSYEYDKSAPCFFAAGWGGQRIHVFPELDMVVVFTGGSYVGEEPVGDIITRFVLPAVQ